MAATSAKPPPPDDWEDVIDDTYSVVSLPSDIDDESAIIVPSPGSSSIAAPKSAQPPGATAGSARIATSSNSPAPPSLSSARLANRNPTAPGRDAKAPFSSQKYHSPGIPTDASKGIASTRAEPSLDVADLAAKLRDLRTESHEHGTAEIEQSGDSARSDDKTVSSVAIPISTRTETYASRARGGAYTSIDEHTSSHSNDAAHHTTDPALILKVLDSVVQVVRDTTAAAPRLESAAPLTAQRICWVAGMLSQQLKELRTIVGGYSKHGGTRNRPRPDPIVDLPLDPGLYEWLCGLRGKLLAVQGEIQWHFGLHRQEDALPSARFNLDLSQLDKHIEALSSFEKRMDTFLPIMQVDFNEYEGQRTGSAARPQADVDDWPRLSRRLEALSQTQADVTPILPELQVLRTQLQDILEKLHEYRKSLPPSAARLAGDIASSFGTILGIISRALSLHLPNASVNWRADGGEFELAHVELSALDPASIEQLAENLRQIGEILDIEQDPQIAATWSPQMVRDHRNHMLMEEGQLDALESVASVLTAVLIPDRAQ